MSLSRAVAAGVALLAAALLGTPEAMGSGVSDEKMLASFQDHLDLYESEIGGLATAVDKIVAESGTGTVADGRVDELIEQWEAVSVHEAIEYKVTIAYPGIWQGIVGLKQAIDSGGSVDEVSASGEALKAALWQGLGALKLAASQAGS